MTLPSCSVPPSRTMAVAAELWASRKHVDSSAATRTIRDRICFTSNQFQTRMRSSTCRRERGGYDYFTGAQSLRDAIASGHALRQMTAVAR